jgi:hypothetical protein
VRRYAEELRVESEATGVALGEPRFDHGYYDAKIALLEREKSAVVRPPSAARTLRLCSGYRRPGWRCE